MKTFFHLVLFWVLTACADAPLNAPIPLPVGFPLDWDFETGLDSAWHREAARPEALAVLPPPPAMTGAGTSALRLRVEPADVANHGNRAEAALYNVAQFGDEVWYGFDVFVPAGDPADYRWQILTQFYQLPDFERGETFEFWSPHPPVTLVLEPGKLVLMRNVGQETRLAEAVFTAGAAHRLLVHCRWSDGPSGLVEAWLDGTALNSGGQTSFSGPTLWNRAGAYWKIGLYRGAPGQIQAPSANEVWFDNVRLDRTRAGAE